MKRVQEKMLQGLNNKREPVEIIVRKAGEEDVVLLCDAKDEEHNMPAYREFIKAI